MQFSLLFHTLRHLRGTQLYYQLRYRLYKAHYRQLSAPVCKNVQAVVWTDKAQCWEGEDTFCFLNIRDTFCGWNDTRHGMLWAYNLNYMDWLAQPSLSCHQGAAWIDRFIATLPQNTIGLDPYPIALRGINWIKFIVAHGGEMDAHKLQMWNDALYSQYQLLARKMEYHLLANHLLEDTFSLFIASVYFQDQAFFNTSSRLLRRELKEQTLADGAHYEQSPMYHAILLDRLLDCYNFSHHNAVFAGQESLTAFMRTMAEAWLGHLESIAWKDTTLPLLNDAAQGIAPTVAQLREYARRLGLQWLAQPLGECGYRKLSHGTIEAVVDIGRITASYQPGHTHADTFNFELRSNGQPFIVDTGISTYNKTPRRQYERSTAAHNTVTIDGKDSSQVWGGFRVGKRAKVTFHIDAPNHVCASHNGYGRIVHQREFSLSDNELQITDHLSQPANAIARLHLAPDVEIVSQDNNEIVTSRGRIIIDGADEIQLTKDFTSVRYNELLPSLTIEAHFSQKLETSIIPQ